MLDIQFIRENPEKVKKGVAAKQLNPEFVDRVLELDKKRREIIQKIEVSRTQKNQYSEEVIKIAKEILKNKTNKIKVSPEIIKLAREQLAKEKTYSREVVKEANELLQKNESELEKLEKEYKKALFDIPNLPKDDVKVGKNDTENDVIRKWGEPKKYSFEPKDHLELGEKLGIIDTERASKVSGARFAYLKGDAVLLEFALVQLALEVLIKEGFTPVVPPVLIRPKITEGLGYWQAGGHNDYYLVYDPEEKRGKDEYKGFYLVGTAEHSIVPMHENELLSKEELPKRYVAFSSAFRREAGSYGKDTKGIIRVHQFDKIEMVSFVKEGEDDKEHEYLLSLEEKLFQLLEIPYQVIKMCSGDLGFPAARKYDIEAWMPGQDKYREVTSVSTVTDFQSRRLNIKYQDYEEDALIGDVAPGETLVGGTVKRPIRKYANILNGTAFAIGRTIVAILENNQQKDGSVLIPKILQKWMGKEKIQTNS